MPQQEKTAFAKKIVIILNKKTAVLISLSFIGISNHCQYNNLLLADMKTKGIRLLVFHLICSKDFMLCVWFDSFTQPLNLLCFTFVMNELVGV